MSVPPLDPDHAVLASKFGWRKLAGSDDLHTGIDLAARIGEPVVAVDAGTVVVSAPPGELAGYGNVVVIRHDYRASRPIFSLYAHMSQRLVPVGATVIEGQQIGAVGDTGGARGVTDHHIGAPHLHFELLTAWPPHGKDLDRIDPTRLWPAGRSSPARPFQLPQAPQRPIAASSGFGAGGFLAIATLLWAKEKRRESY